MNTKLGITNDGEHVGVHILACMKNASDTIVPPLSAQHPQHSRVIFKKETHRVQSRYKKRCIVCLTFRRNARYCSLLLHYLVFPFPFVPIVLSIKCKYSRDRLPNDFLLQSLTQCIHIAFAFLTKSHSPTFPQISPHEPSKLSLLVLIASKPHSSYLPLPSLHLSC